MNARERFGAIVRARREELGLSQRRAWRDRGGPSTPVWTEIEGGTGPEIQGRTLAKLDKALWWEPGSAKRVLEGGDPTALSWDGLDRSDLPPLAPDSGLAEQMAWNSARALLEGRTDLGRLATNQDRVMRGAQAMLAMVRAGLDLGARTEDLSELVRGTIGVLVSSGVMGFAQGQFPRAAAKYLRDIAEVSELIAARAQPAVTPQASDLASGSGDEEVTGSDAMEEVAGEKERRLNRYRRQTGDQDDESTTTAG